MAKLLTPFFQAIDGNGAPMPSAHLWFYITGTTTPKNTYSDSALTTPNTNPVVANSDGRFPPIYLAQDADYKAILKSAADVTVGNGTFDPLLTPGTSVIAHEGSIIIGNSDGADSELVVSPTNGASLKSDGTTVVWRSPAYTKQVFLSGSGTYTRPANCTAIKVRAQGGGGGAGGVGGTTGPTGTVGGTSSFNSVTAVGGSPGTGTTSGTAGVPGIGGTGGTGTASLRIPGQAGGLIFSTGANGYIGGPGGGTHMGPGAPAYSGTAATAGGAAPTNTGGGGSGAIAPGTTAPSGSGGGGEYLELHISAPSATYPYVVGAGGAGGIGTGTGAGTGGAGAAGIVIVEEFYW